MRSSPNAQADLRTRDLKRLAGKRDELIGTLYELYGRGNEVVLRVLEDVRTLVSLHQETTELLYVLRSLPPERPYYSGSSAESAASGAETRQRPQASAAPSFSGGHPTSRPESIDDMAHGTSWRISEAAPAVGE